MPSQTYKVDGTRNLRAIHVTPVYLPAWEYGGTVRAIHAMTTALVARGHDVEVVTTTIGTPYSTGGRRHESTIEGVRVTYVPGRMVWGGTASPGLAAEVLKRVGGNTAIHVSSGWQPAFRTMFADLRRRHQPYLYSPHGCFAPEVFSKGRLKKTAYYHLYERNHLRNAAAVVATSEIEATDLLRRDPWVRVVVVPNICDPDVWKPSSFAASAWRKQHAIDDQEIVVLQVCRPDPIKNTAFLVEAVRGLPLGRRYVLVVMGPGQSRIGGDVGLPDHVRVLRIEGDPDSGALRAAYSAAQVVAVPSTYECFGNVVVEATLCGAGVLAAPRVGAARLEDLHRAVRIVSLEVNAWRLALSSAPDYRKQSPTGIRGRLAATCGPAAVAERLAALYTGIMLPSVVERRFP